ncbi:MAG: PH domain-containing protein, partial [Actinobacteria bacterium]|nr:PH domain-containing protein [Actinomycetota bacterium]
MGAGRFWITPQFIFFERGTLRTDSQQVPVSNVMDVDVTQTLTQKARGVFTLRAHIDRGGRQEIVSMEDIPTGREAQSII